MTAHAQTLDAASERPAIGVLLREWRAARRMSQLDLAYEADVSSRHLGFIETGRAQASREVVSRLARALSLPLREHNALLLAAGYAPHYGERALAAPGMGHLAQAIDLILRHQEPYPAFVISRHFDVLGANEAAVRVNAFLMEGRQSPHANLLRQVFDPADFRGVIANWPDVASKFVRQLQDELVAAPSDQKARALLEEVLAYPGVPPEWRFRDLSAESEPVLTMVFNSRAGPLRFFETITTFAAPRDVTLDELRIDCAFPADDHTAQVCARLASGELS
ncbi:MAG: helix-turn-helix domain-containing protein [Caulobacter sp.]|nr:helix-turn-helix domain-containing protein [Caulobacter sp.]